MKKQCRRNYIDRDVKIEINGFNLTLGMNQGSDEVKTSNTFCRCRFMLDGSLPMWIKFGLQLV